MRKVTFGVALFMTGLTARAETVRLETIDYVQEGVRFKNLGKCLFVQERPEAAQMQPIEIDLRPDDFGNAHGLWKKEVTVGANKVEYRVTAKRQAGAGNELSIDAHILVNGSPEARVAVNLEDSHAPQGDANTVDALVTQDDVNCYAAVLELAKPKPANALQLTMSQAERE